MLLAKNRFGASERWLNPRIDARRTARAKAVSIAHPRMPYCPVPPASSHAVALRPAAPPCADRSNHNAPVARGTSIRSHIPEPRGSEMRRHQARGRAACTAHDLDRKSTRLNSSHVKISYAVFCLKKKKTK